VRCAAELLDAAAAQGITLRAGLHTGEIEIRPTDVTGIAVHTANRISALAEPSEILVSRTVVDLTAGSGLQFEPRGEHQLERRPRHLADLRRRAKQQLRGASRTDESCAARSAPGASTDPGVWSDCGSVSDVPETRFTHSAAGVRLAYQVSGEGPLNLVFLRDELMPLDLMWDDPWFLRLSKRLGVFSRTVWYDPRGVGASEGDWSGAGEHRDAVVLAVLDAAVGSEPVALLGWGASGVTAIRISVMQPERVSALVLVNSYAHYVRDDDYPWGLPRDSLDRLAAARQEGRDTGAVLELFAPSRSTDERFRAWWARTQRLGVGAEEWGKVSRAAIEWDVRPLLASVSVPTLVLHREEDRYIRLGAGRYLAEHIPGARLVVLPGADHALYAGDVDAVVDEIEEFLTGARSGVEGDVVLAAVLFTDLVASTEQQARMGRREWSRVAEDHDAMVRRALTRHRGHEVKTMGDGFLATFDATGRALRCAAEILAGAKGLGLELRAGVHTGEVEVRGDDIAGLAVTIAKRVCDLAGPDHVLVSETVRSLLVGSGIEFQGRGERELKGVPGTWRLFALKTPEQVP
jgi:class 3 adenylate cyclase/pimeloyl-ACP methyl ester carboxylesterase